MMDNRMAMRYGVSKRTCSPDSDGRSFLEMPELDELLKIDLRAYPGALQPRAK